MLDGTKNEPQTALYAALAKAQAQAHEIEKDARNKFHAYNYVSAEAMIREAKEILTANGLALVPTGSSLDPPAPIVTEDNDYAKNARAAATLNASWLVVHRDGGELQVTCAWPVAPEKGRPIDKAVAAARTASLSYLLRDLLQIPRVEEGTDLDDNSRDAKPAARSAPKRDDGGVTIGDDLRKAIGHELDRLAAVGSERKRMVVQFAAPDAADSVAGMTRALDKLKTMN